KTSANASKTPTATNAVISFVVRPPTRSIPRRNGLAPLVSGAGGPLQKSHSDGMFQLCRCQRLIPHTVELATYQPRPGRLTPNLRPGLSFYLDVWHVELRRNLTASRVRCRQASRPGLPSPKCPDPV